MPHSQCQRHSCGGIAGRQVDYDPTPAKLELEMLKTVAAILAFCVELATLWAYGSWGFHLPFGLLIRVASGVAAGSVVAGIWGVFLAPMAKRRLPVVPGAIAKFVIFSCGVDLTWAIGEVMFASVLAVFAAISLALEYLAVAPSRTPPNV